MLASSSSVPRPPATAPRPHARTVPRLTRLIEDASKARDPDIRGGVDDFILTNEVMRLILQEKEDPNEQAWDGETPLMASCVRGEDPMVQLLLAHGAHAGLITSNGSSALSSAMFVYNVPIVRMLLHHGGEGVRQAALQHGLERLLQAAHAGLEARKVMLYVRDPGGIEPQTCTQALTAERWHRMVCEDLTAWFARQGSLQALQSKAPDVSTALPQSLGNSSSAKLAPGQLSSPALSAEHLIELVKRSNAAGLRQALELGADPNTADNMNRTLLVHAATNNHAEVVRLLLCTGRCDLEHRDSQGWTALHHAAFDGYLDVLQLLVAHGSDVNARNFWDRTPLLSATSQHHLQSVRALLAAGADTSVVDEQSATALVLAAVDGRCELITTLLDGGADINSNVCIQGTALVVAARSHQFEAVQLLLSRGADPNLVSATGFTALSWAIKDSHVAMRKALLQVGAKLPHSQDALRLAATRDAFTACSITNIEAVLRNVAVAPLPEGRRQMQLDVLVGARDVMQLVRSSGTGRGRGAGSRSRSSRAAGNVGAANLPQRSSEEADRIAAELLAEEEEEKAKALAKKDKRAKQKAKTRAATAASGPAVGDDAVGACEQQGQRGGQGQGAAGTSSSRLAEEEASAGPVHDTPGAQMSALQLDGPSLGSAPAPPAVPSAYCRPASQPLQQQVQLPVSRQGHSSVAHDDERLCAVCLDGPRSMVLVPCGHVVMCAACCEAVQEASNVCPMCRADIDVAVALNLGR